jgi:hypothetical protein
MNTLPRKRQWTSGAKLTQLLLLFFVVGFLGLTGCGGKPANVSGSVTLDGQPVVRGTVGFKPTSGGMMAAGIIQEDGSYVLKTNRDVGLDTGEYLVTVASRELGKENPNGGPPMPGPYITPRHYAIAKTSGLKFEVAAGSNEINLELSSEVKATGKKSKSR